MNKRKKNIKINIKWWKIILIIILVYLYLGSVQYSRTITNYKYDLVIIIKDLNIFERNRDYYKKFLNYDKIVVISPLNTKNMIKDDNSVLFISEDSLIPKQKINEFLRKMRSISTKRDCWYEQQFLKMAYSRICKNEYYLIWDGDTIPIKYIQMFENGKPFFDMKTEHHVPYFKTMNSLIPGLKFANKSYISEHMLIKTQFMKNLLDRLESNTKLSGKIFWEKILMAIDSKNIDFSGFSEYETYGSYVDTIYPNFYVRRIWCSMREAKIFFDSPEKLSENDIKWLSKYYHALTFEKYHRFKQKNLEIVKNKEIQEEYQPNEFFKNYDYIYRKYVNKNHKA